MAAITLIGSGNVNWHFGKAFAKAGHRIEAVYSRNPTHARELAALFSGCKATDNTDFSASNSEVFIVAIKDSALEELMTKIRVPENSIVAHTSGSMPMDVVKQFSHHGVFYAIQTFTKKKELDLSEVPFGIEASDPDTLHKLKTLALSLSKNVQSIHSEQRKAVHIAAVFACNFTNHLFSISETILKKENLNLSLLEPLIRETLDKALEIGPRQAQTGPAVRGDEKIIQQHLDYLKNEPDLQDLYRMLSESIGKKYNS